MKKRKIIAAAAVSAIAASLSACGVYGPEPSDPIKNTTAETTTTAVTESEPELVIETKLPPSQASAAGDVEEAAADELLDDGDDADSDTMAEETGVEEIE